MFDKMCDRIIKFLEPYSVYHKGKHKFDNPKVKFPLILKILNSHLIQEIYSHLFLVISRILGIILHFILYFSLNYFLNHFSSPQNFCSFRNLVLCFFLFLVIMFTLGERQIIFNCYGYFCHS